MRVLRRFVLPLALLLFFAAPATAGDEVERYELENGLKVMLRPIDGAKDVALCVVFDIGEDHDPKGKSGLAHFVEHCYVTCGAGQVSPRSANAMMAQYGRHGWNALTARDFTVIAFVVKPEQLEKEIQEAALRMGSLEIRPADVERERPRVLHELQNMFHGYPRLAARNQARERVAPSPTGARKGGVPEHIETFTVQDLQKHYTRYFKPGNARLVIAGAFEVEQAKAWVEAHFAALPKGAPPPEKRPPGEAKPGGVAGLTSMLEENEWTKANVTLGVPAPALDDDRYPAFLLLISRLFAAQNMRLLPDEMVAEYSLLEAPDVLYVSAPAKAGESDEDAVARVRKHLVGMARPPLQDTEGGFACEQFTTFFGTGEMTPFHLTMPYVVAFALARRDQLGIDGKALAAKLRAVDAKTYAKVVDALLDEKATAAVVVRPRP